MIIWSSPWARSGAQPSINHHLILCQSRLAQRGLGRGTALLVWASGGCAQVGPPFGRWWVDGERVRKCQALSSLLGLGRVAVCQLFLSSLCVSLYFFSQYVASSSAVFLLHSSSLGNQTVLLRCGGRLRFSAMLPPSRLIPCLLSVSPFRILPRACCRTPPSRSFHRR